MTRHRTHRPDGNQQEIVQGLRACGCTVQRLHECIRELNRALMRKGKEKR